MVNSNHNLMSKGPMQREFIFKTTVSMSYYSIIFYLPKGRFQKLKPNFSPCTVTQRQPSVAQ